VRPVSAGCAAFAACCFALLPVSQAVGQPAASLTVVRAERLLDPRSGNVLSPAAVLIEGDTIKELGAPSQVQAHTPSSAVTIDLGDVTLLPGLIDSHTHLLLDIVVPPEAQITRLYNGEFVPGLLLAIAGMSPSQRVLLGAQLAREDLESGFTTVRNLGHSGIDGDVALRDAIDTGRVPGPRMLAAGRKLTAPGGYFQGLNPAVSESIVRQEFFEVQSPEQARQAVRENIFYNVDVIKVAIGDDLTQAEMTAIADEAHRQNRKVAVHAFTPASIQIAIDAGVDSIEHGNGVTDAQLKQMREKGIFFDLTPTWFDGFWTKIHETSVLSPAFRATLAAKDDRNRERARALVQRVLKSGVKFAAGSDMCWFYLGKTRGQATATMFSSLHEAGMPAAEIIRAVTTNAAQMLGWESRVGALEPGKLADIIAVPGNPVADISELERVGFVMKGGQVIRNDFNR
jgi:imidazolonepropionase-like amidohydrolase